MVLVDVVITTYGRSPEILRRAVESVQAQTVTDISIFIVDDNHPDSQPRLQIRDLALALHETDKRIAYLPNEQNSGACVSRNNGFLAGSAPFVAFLDDDDEWLPTKLEKQLALMSDPSVGLVTAGRTFLYEKTGKSRVFPPQIQQPSYEDMILYGNVTGGTSLPLIRRSVMEEAGLFDPEMQTSQEYDLWLRMAKITKFDSVPETLQIYHVSTEERLSSDPQKKFNGTMRIYEKNREAVDSSNVAYCMIFRMLATYASYMGEMKVAYRYFWDVVSRRPQDLIKNLKCLIKVVTKFSRDV